MPAPPSARIHRPPRFSYSPHATLQIFRGDPPLAITSWSVNQDASTVTITFEGGATLEHGIPEGEYLLEGLEDEIARADRAAGTVGVRLVIGMGGS